MLDSLPMITDHRDGFWLNDVIEIARDAPDAEKGGNASHQYTIIRTDMQHADRAEPGVAVGTLRFQQGPRDHPGSVEGLTDAAVLAVVIDRYRGFQSGPFACDDNRRVLAHLQAALDTIKERARARAARGVLGTLKA